MSDLEYPVNDAQIKIYEDQVASWEDIPFSKEIEASVKEILERCPVPSATMKPAEKQRVFLLRGQATLLKQTKEVAVAEDSFNKVLRLSKKNVAAWLGLAECYVRRAVYKDARDALDTVLSLDAKNVAATIKLSQVIRLEGLAISLGAPVKTKSEVVKEMLEKKAAQSAGSTASSIAAQAASGAASGGGHNTGGGGGDGGADSKKAKQEKAEEEARMKEEAIAKTKALKDALEESIAKAKHAITLDPNSSAAWSMFGVGQYAQAMNAGLTVQDAKKIHFSFTQSINKSIAAGKKPDPDTLCSRSHMSRALADFEGALKDLELAVEIDPFDLGSVKLEAESLRQHVTRIAKVIKQPLGGLNEKIFKSKYVSKLPLEGKEGEKGYAAVGVDEFLLTAAGGGGGKNTKVVVRVMVIANISRNSSAQPQMYHCIDRNGAQLVALLSMYHPKAIEHGDILGIAVPPCTLRVSKVNLGGSAGGGGAQVAGGDQQPGDNVSDIVSVPFVSLDAAGFVVGAENPKQLSERDHVGPKLMNQILLS